MHRFITGFALAALGLCATQVQAQERAVGHAGKLYVGVAPGLVVPEDVSFSRTATTTNSGKIEFKDGYSLAGFAGYEFNDYLRGEASVTYAKVDYDKVSMDGFGTVKVDGDLKSTIGMLNGIVAPLGKTRISPLLGGGVGVAYTKEKASHAGGINVNVDRETNDLALSGLVGVEANITDSVSLGVRYNYFWVDSGEDGRDNFTAHNFSATAAWHF